MRGKITVLLGAALAFAGSAFALVQPEPGTALPDYDVRATLKGVMLGSAPGKRKALQGKATEPALSARQQELFAQLRQGSNGDFVVRWNELTETPRLLFRYQGPITPPSAGEAGYLARNFLSDYADLWGFEPAAVDAFQEVKRMTTTGGSVIVLQLDQVVGGIPVFHGSVRFGITGQGEIAQITTGSPLATVTGLNLVPALDAGEAMRFAGGSMGVELASAPLRINPASEQVARFEKGPFMAEPTAEPVLFPMGRTARLGWMIHAERADVPASYEIIVDAADGTLLYRSNLTKYAQTDGLVFVQDPSKSGNVPVKTQFYDNSVWVGPNWPLGWADSNRSIGNVADVKEDWVGDNEGTIGQRSSDFTPGPPIYFEDPWTNAYESSGAARNDVFFAITNLFYFSNVYHNWLYAYGFDEPSGNWQRSNYGKGGREGDPVMVDAQDSYNIGQRNNANMSTPADGQSPRAQFYLFTAGVFAQRDSDVDADVVVHEFTHGLSHRLIGGGSSANCLNGFQAGSMGEGWADWYACAFSGRPVGDPIMGEYATGNATSGIRSHPYDAYPACHRYTAAGFCSPNSCAGYVTPCEVHDEGQLWGAVLWEMRMLLIAADPVNGHDIALRLVTDGMKLTVCNPSMLDARDGILQADRYAFGGIHQCLIWEAFKDRYMGFSATTTSTDDMAPAGTNDFPPYCLSLGRVVLNLATYGCGDTLTATVQDNDPVGPQSVRLTATPSGDVLIASATGVAPIFTTGPITLDVAPPAADAILQVQPGDVITAEYTDASPANVATTTANVSCLANVTTTLSATGGCSPDGSAWPGTIPQILDAGELVDFQLLIYNKEPRPLTNVTATLVSSSNPMVVALPATSNTIPTILPYTGSGIANFKIGASPMLASGSVTLTFAITANGFTGSVLPITHTIAVMSNYSVVNATTGVENFEASDGGYVHYPWPYAAPADDWRYPGCAAASGTRAWGAANIACSGPAAEQDANLETPPLDPVSPTRIAWYPTDIRFNHRLNLGPGGSPTEQVVVGLSELNPTVDGDIASYALLTAADNTGATFQAVSIPFTAADSAGLDKSNGLVVWWDMWTLSGSPLSTEWIVDDVEIAYTAADAVPQGGPATCVEASYSGSLTSCAAGSGYALYNTTRPAEMQYAGNGRFWNVATDWNMFDVEFPTPSAATEKLVFVASANPDNGAHQGTFAVNGRQITTPNFLAFGPSTCASIPTPAPGATTVVTGQPIFLSWPAFTESGNVASIVGYRVYRLDAETWPAATSTIANYVANGVLVGSTIGQSNINQFSDTAPAVVSGTDDLFTYAIQPVLRCDPSPSCSNPVPLTFGGSETVPGTANLSTDSAVVRVSRGLLAAFDTWAAERDGSTVKVSWRTTSEIDTLGFHVYRGSDSDPSGMIRANTKLIQGQGRQGGDYQFVDVNAPAGVVYYQIREVASSGQPSRTDVFAATTRGDSTPGSRRRTRGAGASGGASGKARSAEGRIR